MVATTPASKALDEIIGLIQQAGTKLKGSEDSAEAIAGLTRGLAQFAEIDWSSFGEGAAEGLAKFAGLSDNFESAANAISALDKNVMQNAATLGELSVALSSFAEIKWAGVAQGLIVMSGMPKLFNIAAAGFKAAGQAVAGLKKHKDSFDALQALGDAFRSFSEISWTQVIFGITGMKMASVLFPSLGTSLEKLKNVIGGSNRQTIKAFSEFVNALKTFSQISWSKVMFGLTIVKIFNSTFTTISSVSKAMEAGAKSFRAVAGTMGAAIGDFFSAIPFGQVAKGLLIFAGLAVSIGLLAGAFMLFSKVDWNAVETGFWALTMFAGVVGIFAVLAGAIGPGLLILAGLGAALLIFGASLIVVGKGVQFLADGFKSIGDTIPKMTDSFKSMAGMAGGLLKTAGAIAVVSAAIIAFSAAAAASSIGGAIGGAISGAVNFLTGSKSTNPIDQLARLADMSDKLNQTASALERINSAISGMPSKAGIDLAINSTQGAELASAKNMMTAAGGMGIIDASTKPKAITNNVSSTIVNNGWMPDRSTALVLAPAF